MAVTLDRYVIPHIVTCVNAHEALVEACESALSLLTEYRERVIKGRITGDLVPGDYEPVAQLRAALALAKEMATASPSQG